MTAPVPAPRWHIPLLLWQALYFWLVVALLVLVFGLLEWAFTGSGGLATILRSAILWPAHFAQAGNR